MLEKKESREPRDTCVTDELHELRSLLEINVEGIKELRQQVRDLQAYLVHEPARIRGRYSHSSDKAWEERLRIESRVDNLSRWIIFLLTIALFGTWLIALHPCFSLP